MNLKRYKSTESTISGVSKSHLLQKDSSKLESAINNKDNKQIEESYINLLNVAIDCFKLKGKNSEVLSIPFNAEVLREIELNNDVPLNMKLFSSNIRVASKHPFERNLLEVLLLPISKNVSIEEEMLYLTDEDDLNYNNYKEILRNDILRESLITYVDRIPEFEQGAISSSTTLKSFEKNPIVTEIVGSLKSRTMTQTDRYRLLGLFIDSILFEVIDSSRGKRSKAKFINLIIDLFTKPMS